MKKQTRFRPYNPDQDYLFPPNMKDWLPADDLAYFIMDMVKLMDLCEIYGDYDGRKGGQPPYDPEMMTNLVLYAYCVGVSSSRKIEKATYHSIPFRVITGDQHPDHDTIAEFRKRHLKALDRLFLQVLQRCQEVGLVKLGHVALDGTKVKANASKHKAMSYGRMKKTLPELQETVKRLLAEAQAVDDEEDAKYGKGKRGDELPEELRTREGRIKKIKEAMKTLEERAKKKADKRRKEIRDQDEDRKKKGKKRRGKKAKEPSDEPEPRAQCNFTDPESRIMKDSASKSFIQGYNAQAAVDETSQIIVAAHVTQEANDKQQVVPMVEQIKANTGTIPKRLTADTNYYSETNVNYLAEQEIDAYIATEKVKHSKLPPPAPRGRIPKNATTKERMQRKLRTIKGRCTYANPEISRVRF